MRQRPATGAVSAETTHFRREFQPPRARPRLPSPLQAAASCAHLPATPFEAQLQDTALPTQAPPALPASGLAAHLLRHGPVGPPFQPDVGRDLNHRLDSREGRFVRACPTRPSPR